MSRNQAPRSKRPSNVLRGTHRSAIVGTDSSARFYIDMQRERETYVDVTDREGESASLRQKVEGEGASKLKPKPKRFENYTPQRPTAEDIKEKQRLAEQRKKQQEELKIQRAKKVSEEAMKFDKTMKPYFDKLEKQKNLEKKWFSSALKKS